MRRCFATDPLDGLPMRRYRCPQRLAYDRGETNGHDPPDRNRRARGRAERAAGEGSPASVDALHAHGRVRRARTRSRSSCAARARYVYDEHGKRYLDGLSALFCVNAGHGRAELGEAAARQAKELGFYTNWSYAHPGRDRAGRADRGPRAGRPQPRLLHLGRLGGGRVGLEAGAPVPQAQRRPAAHEDHLARDRLPRHHLRRALDHRHHAAAHAVRAARAGRLPRAQHERLPLARGARPALGRATRSST